MKKKTVALLLAVVMLFGITVGGTLAWLTDKTDEVKNTFTTSDVDIELAETTGEKYQMIPGHYVTKNPIVTVKAVSEKSYVFVKLDKSTNFDTYMEYEMAVDKEGKEIWTELDGVAGVYYLIAENTDTDQTFDVLKDNKVNVKVSVTKKMMNDLTEETYPTLTVTAYACQCMKNNTENFTPAEAWSYVSEA